MATATKRTASSTRTSARKPTQQAQRTARQAEVTVDAYVKETGFAAIGAGDAAVALVRRVVSTPFRIPGQLRSLPENVRAEFWRLSDRGRELSGRIERDPAVQRAADQVSIARSQVKAATTSVGRAFDAQRDAAGHVADKVAASSRENLDDLTVEELQDRASGLDVEGRSSMNKAELIKAIRAAK